MVKLMNGESIDYSTTTRPLRIVLVHGFNVRDAGERSIDQLAWPLRHLGHEADTDSADYGYFGLLGVRFFRGKRRREALGRLEQAFDTADIIVTHSNGANFATEAMKRFSAGRQFNVVHVSPALNMDTPPPASVGRQLVYHTMNDGWVRLARILPWHPWGAMGAYGYQGDDRRVESRAWPSVNGHGDWFNETHRRRLAEEITSWATA